MQIIVFLNMSEFKGIFPATITPMHKDFSLDLETFELYINWLKSQNVSGFAINVDTGEGPSLTKKEKMILIKKAKEISGNLKIVAGILGNSTESAIEESKMAKMSGADALLIFPNAAFRGKPQETDLISKYHEAIASEVNTDIIIFNLQEDLGGTLYTFKTLEKLISIPQVKAIKEASFDISTFKSIYKFLKQQNKKIDFLTGNDNFILESFLLGVDGGLLGSCAQFTKFQVDCFNFVKNKNYDKAIELSNFFQPLIDVIFMSPVRNYRARTKYSLMLQGIVPNAYVRPPLLELPETEKQIICNSLKNSKIIKD